MKSMADDRDDTLGSCVHKSVGAEPSGSRGLCLTEGYVGAFAVLRMCDVVCVRVTALDRQ